MKIVVLCGGISTEREISIVSGEGVCRALRSRGHRAILLDVYFGDENVNLMDAFPEEYDVEREVQKIHLRDSMIESAVKNPSRDFFGANVTRLCKMADIVFLALHGSDGENGKVQAAFDLRKIRYTGTGHIGSALAMDKGLSKIIMKAAGIPTPPGFTLTRKSTDTDPADHGMEFPVVVKVCCGGSSVGVYIVRDQAAYTEALQEAFSLEPEVVVEEYIEGREFSVGVVDGEALPVIEIAPIEGFYDYRNKYTAGATIETCPAEISGEETRRMREMAEAGFRALCMDAYGRLDFLMRPDGRIYCLEANSLPGMTPTSLIPQEAASIGVDYPEFCEKLIEVSLKKYEGGE